jgi:hypothetical protein
MKRQFRVLLSAAIITLGFTGTVLAGDTLSKPGVLSEESISLTEKLSSKYDTIVIRDYTTDKAEYNNVDDKERAVIDKMTPSLVRTIGDSLEADLKEKKLFKKVVRNGKPSGRAVILEGSIAEFNAGSKALKWFVGYGAGKVYLKGKGRLIDAQSGKELASYEDRETGYLGSMTTMSFDDVFPIQAKSMGESLAKFIEKLY